MKRISLILLLVSFIGNSNADNVSTTGNKQLNSIKGEFNVMVANHTDLSLYLALKDDARVTECMQGDKVEVQPHSNLNYKVTVVNNGNCAGQEYQKRGYLMVKYAIPNQSNYSDIGSISFLINTLGETNKHEFIIARPLNNYSGRMNVFGRKATIIIDGEAQPPYDWQGNQHIQWTTLPI